MVIEISKEYVKVNVRGRVVAVPGEAFSKINNF